MMTHAASLCSFSLTPRWTCAIDRHAEARCPDARGPALTSVVAPPGIVSDKLVPRLPVPLADQPRRRTPERAVRVPVHGPTPLSVPQEIESVVESQDAQSPGRLASRIAPR